MKLWILRPKNSDRHGGPWDPWYDKSFGFVVRAETEEGARAFADQEAGDENRGGSHPWFDPTKSTCVPLTNEGEAGVIIRDFASA